VLLVQTFAILLVDFLVLSGTGFVNVRIARLVLAV